MRAIVLGTLGWTTLFCNLCSAEVITGSWSLERTAVPGRLRLVLTRPDVIVGGRQVLYLNPQAPLGLDASAWESSGATVSWVLDREAGSLDFEGVSESGKIAGRFRFTENPLFVAAVRRLLNNWWDSSSLLDLAVRAVPLSYARALREKGAAGFSAAELARRYESASLTASDALVPRPLNGLRASGTDDVAPRAAGLSDEEAARLLLHGVSPAYFQALKESGYPLFPEDAARLYVHGVSGDLLRQMKLSGHDNFNVSDMIRLRNLGVTNYDLQTFELRTGKTNLSVDEIVKLKVNGVR